MLGKLLRALGRAPAQISYAVLDLWLVIKNLGQLRAFLALRDDFRAKYERIGTHGVSELSTPHWESMNRDYERFLLPRPPVHFLRNALLRSQMFVDRRHLEHELPVLKDHFGVPRLRELSVESPVGMPQLMLLENKSVTSPNTIHMLYHWYRFEQHTGRVLYDVESVIEWGGGYGNVARMAWEASRGNMTYTIIDSPIMASVQWLYLSSVVGRENVNLLTDQEAALQPDRINIVPVTFLPSLELTGELFYSTWALDESSLLAQRHVTDRDWFGAKHMLMVTSFEPPSRGSDHWDGVNDAGLAEAAKAWGAAELPFSFMPWSRYWIR